jgi:Flp pilus assembly pilin Flp
MRKLFQNFRSEESGATLVEYGVALIMAIVLGGTALATLANNTSTQMGKPNTIFTASGNN